MSIKLTQHEIDQNTALFMKACKIGDIDEVKRLIPISNPKENYSFALQEAANLGRTDIVELLIPVSDVFTSYALETAVECGHIDVVKLLIPMLDPEEIDINALQLAVRYGHLEIVKLLIPLSNPKKDNSKALRAASFKRHRKIMEALIPVSDYKDVLQRMKNDGWDASLLQQCIDEHEALQQKDRLTNHLNDPSDSQKTSIKRKM